MRINLTVSEEELAMLQKVAEYHRKSVPGYDPKITSVAKICMLSGLRELVQVADNLAEMKKAKKKE